MLSEEELLKFKPSKKDDSDDLEWLSQIYGGQKKKRTVKTDNGGGKCVKGGKGEGSSGSSLANCFEVEDLACFGRKDFGVVIGMEKEGNYKVWDVSCGKDEGLIGGATLLLFKNKKQLKTGKSLDINMGNWNVWKNLLQMMAMQQSFLSQLNRQQSTHGNRNMQS